MIFYFLAYKCLKIWRVDIQGQKNNAYISR